MARKMGQIMARGPHIWLVRVYARRDSLAQKPCPSARRKYLILWGRFAQFALLGIRWFWAANHANH